MSDSIGWLLAYPIALYAGLHAIQYAVAIAANGSGIVSSQGAARNAASAITAIACGVIAAQVTMWIVHLAHPPSRLMFLAPVGFYGYVAARHAWPSLSSPEEIQYLQMMTNHCEGQSAAEVAGIASFSAYWIFAASSSWL